MSIIIEQDVPTPMKKSELEKYATSFFGYGRWDAPCWVIGLEEKGAKTRGEFQNRFKAWQKCCRARGKSNCKDGLVDLKHYHQACEIIPDVHNVTWRNLHTILSAAGFNVGKQICDLKDNWGGKSKSASRPDSKPSNVAMIEALPFPTRGGSGWPYANWRREYGYMESKKACADEFLCLRLCRIAKEAVKRKPKLVIVYGKGDIALRERWECLIKQKFSKSWKPKSFGELKLKHLKEGKTWYFTIDHPGNQYQKKEIPEKIGMSILSLIKKGRNSHRA